MRWCSLVWLVALVGGCVGVMKPDPYAPAVGEVVAGASGVPDVRCAGSPATGPARGFSSWRQRLTMRLARPDHRGVDMITTSTGEQIVRGKIAYGLLDKGLTNEPVELFACVTGIWQRIGTARTDRSGRFAYALHGMDRLPVGLRDLYASVIADRSGVRFLAYIAPAGSRVLVSDVDGTLTSSETAFIKGLVGRRVEPHTNAAASLRAAAEAGYQIIYLTARGDRFTDETRHWLGTHGFPRGPMRLVPGLFVMPGSATVAYKQRTLAELAGFTIAAGVGNRASDIAAYAGAGVPPERIFVKLPEYSGELAKSLTSGAALGFGAYSRLPLSP